MSKRDNEEYVRRDLFEGPMRYLLPIGLVACTFGLMLGGIMYAENNVTNAAQFDKDVSAYNEVLSDEIETSFDIKNFKTASISLNTEDDYDYIKLFGTRKEDGVRKFTNIYVSVDENELSRISAILDSAISNGGLNNLKDAEKDYDKNRYFSVLAKYRDKIENEVIKVIQNATEADYYVENVGDVDVIKNMFGELITGSALNAENNGIYAETARDFTIGNFMISDIRKDGEAYVLDFVGLDEDLIYGKGTITAGLGLSTSGIGAFVGTSNQTTIEEEKTLNNYSLRITAKGSSLEQKLQSLSEGDKNFSLSKEGKYNMMPRKVDGYYQFDNNETPNEGYGKN